MPSTTISISTRSHKQVLDITDKVEQAIASLNATGGLCNIFVMHTTAALATGEAIEGTDEDLLETLQRMIPKINFRHAHDPSHAPDHMIGSILGASLTLPIQGGRLALGTWQRVLFIELNGPRDRKLIVTIIPA